MNMQVPLKKVKHYDLQSFISKCELIRFFCQTLQEYKHKQNKTENYI